MDIRSEPKTVHLQTFVAVNKPALAAWLCTGTTEESCAARPVTMQLREKAGSSKLRNGRGAKGMVVSSRYILLLLCAAFILSCTTMAVADSSVELLCNNSKPDRQGWSEDCRQWFYHATQGSRLIQKKWLLALEQKDSQQDNLKFFHSELVEKYRYLPDPPHKYNPLGLPIGFTLDCEGSDSPPCNPPAKEWVGITCAACHTGEIQYKGTSLRIEGGPTMADFVGFLRGLLAALEATNDDQGPEGKFTRFADRVLETKAISEEEKNALLRNLRGELWAYIDGLKALPGVTLKDPNHSQYDAGYGRGDAFGLLINQIVYRVMGRKPAGAYSNQPPALNAPVSMPFLWYTPTLRWVQWNGSVGSPLVRNFGQALGAFGLVTPGDEFKHISLEELSKSTHRVENWKPLGDLLKNSHIRVENLKHIEDLVSWLIPPQWSVEVLGEIDLEKRKEGEEIYKERCVGCHVIPRQNNSQERHHEAIEVVLLLDTEVGTDMTMTRNFVCNKIRPDPKQDGSAFDRLDDTHKTAALAASAVANSAICEKYPGQGPPASATFQGVVNAAGMYLDPPNLDLMEDSRKFGSPEIPPCTLCYKAGPLRGIWATSPYLHNGSVPNLKQLLLPEKCQPEEKPGEDCRMKTFCVGSREFDPGTVGFFTENGGECKDGTFKFDTTQSGNFNTGHLYGTKEDTKSGKKPLTDQERAALLEYLKVIGEEDK